MINFDYIRTSTAKAAVEAKAKSASSEFIAGGTNLVDLMKKGVTSPEKLIDINCAEAPALIAWASRGYFVLMMAFSATSLFNSGYFLLM